MPALQPPSRLDWRGRDYTLLLCSGMTCATATILRESGTAGMFRIKDKDCPAGPNMVTARVDSSRLHPGPRDEARNSIPIQQRSELVKRIEAAEAGQVQVPVNPRQEQKELHLQ